jgi:hypothetical protein
MALYTAYFVAMMQLAIAANRFSAVVAKQHHTKFFSTRNANCLIGLAAIFAAIANIPGIVYGLEINPYLMTSWYINVPNSVHQMLLLQTVGSWVVVVVVAITYTTAYIILRYNIFSNIPLKGAVRGTTLRKFENFIHAL